MVSQYTRARHTIACAAKQKQNTRRMTSLAKVIGGGRGTRTPEGRIIIVGNTFPWTSPNTRGGGGGGGDGRVKELGVGGGGARGETVGTVDSRGGGGGGDKTGK